MSGLNAAESLSDMTGPDAAESLLRKVRLDAAESHLRYDRAKCRRFLASREAQAKTRCVSMVFPRLVLPMTDTPTQTTQPTAATTQGAFLDCFAFLASHEAQAKTRCVSMVFPRLSPVSVEYGRKCQEKWPRSARNISKYCFQHNRMFESNFLTIKHFTQNFSVCVVIVSQ